MSTSNVQDHPQSETLFGHPTGLFALFFAEMWERFSYYGMRALLVFYMIKGFLGYNDNDAYGVYGAYTALVYATPFIGGMLADRLLGRRQAVILGGLLMAAGHLAMTVENETVFFIALALLICGNGFFKPNISTIVGSLYPKGSPKKDAGFTIFYMGINLGAAMSPVICGYVGETWGWHYGFGLATAGMLLGVAVFVAPTRLTQWLILSGAIASAVAMPFLQDTLLQLFVCILLSVSLATAGFISFVALGRGGLPEEAGAPPSEERLASPAFPELRENAVTYYLAIIAAILALQLVAAPSSLEGWMLAGMAAAAIVLPWVTARYAVFVCVAGAIPTFVLLVQRNEVAGSLLLVLGVLAFGSLLREALRSTRIERQRMYVVLILMFFSMLFWAFFEQAGSSVNNFTDRNIDRVEEDYVIDKARFEKEAAGAGEYQIKFRIPPKTDDEELQGLPLLSQEQLGWKCDEEVFQRVARAKARQEAEKEKKEKEAGKEEALGSHVADLAENVEKIVKRLDQERDDEETTVSVRVSPKKVPEGNPPKKDEAPTPKEGAPRPGAATSTTEVTAPAAEEDVTISEDGGPVLVFTFQRTGDTKEALPVRFDVSGTATFIKPEKDKEKEEKDKDKEKTDYTQTGADSFGESSGTVTIPAGVSEATVTIDPMEDEKLEEDETVVLTVASGADYVPGDRNEATGTIRNDDRIFTITHLSILRDEAKRDEATDEDKVLTWTVTREHIGMGVGKAEIPASVFQAANPIFILLFGLVFSALWAVMEGWGIEPSTPVKFALGLVQLGLAFGAFWYGAQMANDRGMVAMSWLLLGYLLQTTGELCLSPVGLAMVTKLSPGRIVSTVMGAWFLATAFSNYLAGIIATFTGVSHGEEGQQVIPPPQETVDLYGDVFGTIALTAIVSGLICLALAPLLTRWMHSEVETDEEAEAEDEA